jgi:hypothetical protein
VFPSKFSSKTITITLHPEFGSCVIVILLRCRFPFIPLQDGIGSVAAIHAQIVFHDSNHDGEIGSSKPEPALHLDLLQFSSLH